jgi:hypothetical protein
LSKSLSDQAVQQAPESVCVIEIHGSTIKQIEIGLLHKKYQFEENGVEFQALSEDSDAKIEIVGAHPTLQIKYGASDIAESNL